MSEHWISLMDVPAEGREFSFPDQSVWLGDLAVSGLDHLPGEPPVTATLFVRDQEPGVLVNGKISGKVRVLCDRCTKRYALEIDHAFDEYEPGEEEAEPGEPVRVRQGREGRELDAGSLLWEQYQLALPAKPLCSPDCKGLCPSCGQNLNQAECDCHRDDGDPRLAIFRDLKLK